MREDFMHTIDHIIWDWNGTLLDDAQICVECLNILLTRRGKSPVTLSEYRARFGFPVKQYYEQLGIDFSKENWDSLTEEFHEIYSQKYHKARLKKNVPEVLAYFNKKGVKMSILSASEKKLLNDALKRFEIDRYFFCIQARDDYYAESKIEHGKLLIQRIRGTSKNILLVGDTTHDYEVAVALGISCILVGDGHHSEERLKKCNCPYIPDVSHLPDIIIGSC